MLLGTFESILVRKRRFDEFGVQVCFDHSWPGVGWLCIGFVIPVGCPGVTLRVLIPQHHVIGDEPMML